MVLKSTTISYIPMHWAEHIKLAHYAKKKSSLILSNHKKRIALKPKMTDATCTWGKFIGYGSWLHKQSLYSININHREIIFKTILNFCQYSFWLFPNYCSIKSRNQPFTDKHYYNENHYGISMPKSLKWKFLTCLGNLWAAALYFSYSPDSLTLTVEMEHVPLPQKCTHPSLHKILQGCNTVKPV